MRCSATGSVRSAIRARAGRRARRPGSAPSPASGPASAAARCLNCSVVAAPSAKLMLTAVSSATSRGSPPAAARTVPAPACARNACSSITPAYRDQSAPWAGSGQAGGPPPGGRPAPGSGSASARGSGSRSVPGPGTAPAPGSGSGSGSVNRGSAGGRPAPPPGAGACPRGPRPRPTVVFATPSRLPISASLAPCSRHALACSHCAAVTFPGVPRRSCMARAADPSRFAALCSVATYASDRPSAAATARPRNPSCRSTASAMFRITTSPAA